MGTLLLQHANVITKAGVLRDYSVVCRDTKIEAVLADTSVPATEHFDEVMNVSGDYLVPGFIDLHIHGTESFLIDKGYSHLDSLCSVLPRHGVTGFLPTVTPRDDASEDNALLRELSSVESHGSQILGFFLEGHFLALTGSIRRLSVDRSASYVEGLQHAARPHKLVFGISPELEGITNLIPSMVSQGYPAFITHTQATVEQTVDAIHAGARHATHFYDVFPYIGDVEGGVRGCGAVEAILADSSVSVDFILDGEHVHPIALEMAMACKGSGKVALITDANAVAGLPPGTYEGLGGYEVVVAYRGGPARLTGENLPASLQGGLSGSGLTMDLAVRNAVRLLKKPLHEAVAMASTNPARVLGLDHRKGRIEPGYDADLVTLNRDLVVTSCWCKGVNAYSVDSR